MDFTLFKDAVAKQFQQMYDSVKDVNGGTLFRSDIRKDALWDAYLTSFPPGTNPIYRQRAEYDCSACRSFIKAVGDVVAITDDGITSIWDIVVDEPAFQTVADALAKLVKEHPIQNVFLHTERTAGIDKNYEKAFEHGEKKVRTWEHFFINVPRQFIVKNKELGTRLSHAQALHDVMKRSLDELTDDAITTVLDLIAQNSLYRGEENKAAVESFRELKAEYDAITDSGPQAKDNFAWARVFRVPQSVAKIRNTAIGTLLTDLSADVDLEEAVRKFEAVVAPANYKRPTALVTPGMVEKAKEKVEDLGLTSALGRRYATLSDISVNDILFADRTAKKNLSDNIFDEVAASVSDKKPKDMDKIEEIPIEKFIRDIMPQATTLELMVEAPHIKHLVSLVAPTDVTANLLFKWGNNFSWAYNGDMADSIREKVKAAGGNVIGDLCCRLAWYNHDDLDLHMLEPGNIHIYYAGKISKSTGGQLDVDMNANTTRLSREPVENIFYGSKGNMKEGTYLLYVNQFCQRETKDVGFEAEIDFMGDVIHFAYDKAVKGDVTVALFTYSHKHGVKILESLPSLSGPKGVWGLVTNKYYKVNLVMFSPNHWESSGSGIGNKHYLFILDGCVNPEPARGFFNEFLKEELNEHRKVFEIVGSKMKTPESVDQLSGLGFSSTQRANVLCRVSGSFNRIIKIVF
jgi:hypothetical protein